MITNKSTKYNADGEFWHDGRRIIFHRIWGGLSFVGEKQNIIIVGEENFFNSMHYYIIVEVETELGDSLMDLFQYAVLLSSLYKSERWFGRLDVNINETLAVSNRTMYNSGMRGLFVTDIPRINEYINEGVGLIQSLVKPQEKRLHFFEESMIPSELFALQEGDKDSRLYPRTTALCCVLWGLLRFGYDNVKAILGDG